MAWSGEEYQARFDRLVADGVDVHGEADLVEGLGPRRVLDAGCGTGRVAIELARRGIAAVGIDVAEPMLTVARRRAPALEWRQGDLATAALEPAGFDAIVLAGNVMIFLAPGSEPAVVANLARALAPGGWLVAGFQLDRRAWTLADYDGWAASAGLVPAGRWATWDRGPWTPEADYAVSVHHRPEATSLHLDHGPEPTSTR